MGTFVALVSFGLILFLSILDALSSKHPPYLGILTFIILPGVLIVGLLAIAYGIYREHKKNKAGLGKERILPILDFNNPKHRFSFTIFTVGTILLLLFTTFGSF